jgi:hypothetical protein
VGVSNTQVRQLVRIQQKKNQAPKNQNAEETHVKMYKDKNQPKKKKVVVYPRKENCKGQKPKHKYISGYIKTQ